MSICSAFSAKGVFPPEMCDRVLQKFAEQCKHDQRFIAPPEKMREILVCPIPNTLENEWIFNKVLEIVKKVNSDVFKLDIDGVETVQLVCYEKGHFHDWHIDFRNQRKLSISIELSDPSDYEGAKLTFGMTDKHTYAIPNICKGDATVFTSVIRHKVTSLTQGKRYALVAWITGPPFK